MANPLMFYGQLQIIQATGLPLQQRDTVNHSVNASLSGLWGINCKAISGLRGTYDVSCWQDYTHHPLVFDEPARATSTTSVPHEATKGRTDQSFISGHGGARSGTMANPLIFYAQEAPVQPQSLQDPATLWSLPPEMQAPRRRPQGPPGPAGSAAGPPCLASVLLQCQPRDYGKGSVVCVCDTTQCDFIGVVRPEQSGVIAVYESSKAGKRFDKTTLSFNEPANPDGNDDAVSVVIDSSKKYQSIFGFGGAFTDAAGVNIQSLPEQLQEAVLKSYYSDEGLAYNLGRVPMASCDFSVRQYTYNDVPGDLNMSHFALAAEDFSVKVLGDPEAAKFVQGVAVHWYANDYMGPWVLDKTHNNFPDKFILATEACEGWRSSDVEKVILGSWKRAENYAHDILEVQCFVATSPYSR
ncbi:lysosomal acid glucosylceramidase-like [Ixodes scapularis]